MPGKCSHGGAADLTSTAAPRGGINKDESRPDNVALHNAAVNAATAASLQLLEDIRSAAGDKDFLRYDVQAKYLKVLLYDENKPLTVQTEKDD